MKIINMTIILKSDKTEKREVQHFIEDSALDFTSTYDNKKNQCLSKILEIKAKILLPVLPITSDMTVSRFS